MFILIEDVEGNFISVKKSDIRRVHSTVSGKTYVLFNGGNKNPSIQVKESVKDFHTMHLEK